MQAVFRLGGREVKVDQARMSGINGEYIAWSWYRIGSLYTSNDYLAKLREAWVKLGFDSAGIYRIVLVVSDVGTMEVPVEEAQIILDEYLGNFDGW